MKFNRRTNSILRLADRYAGIPLVFLPSLYRKKRTFPENIQRICLVKTSGIGDTVLLSAVVKDMVKHFHGCDITVVTGVGNYLAAKYLLGRISGTVNFAVADFNDFSTISNLRHLREYDLLIDFGQWPRFDAFLSMIIKSRYRIGFKRKRQYRHYSYDLSVEHSSEKHEINNFRALAGAAGVLCLYGTEIEESYETPDISDNTICVHMCASGQTAKYRMWPMENWADLLQQLDDRGYDIIFSGGYSDREYIEAVAGFAGLSHCRMMLDTHFDMLVPVLRFSRYVVSVDTGIAHLAAACGARLIELLGPTNPDRWGAVGENVTYVRPENIVRMLDLGHEFDADMEAMKRITVKQVLQYIE